MLPRARPSISPHNCALFMALLQNVKLGSTCGSLPIWTVPHCCLWFTSTKNSFLIRKRWGISDTMQTDPKFYSGPKFIVVHLEEWIVSPLLELIEVHHPSCQQTEIELDNWLIQFTRRVWVAHAGIFSYFFGISHHKGAIVKKPPSTMGISFSSADNSVWNV